MRIEQVPDIPMFRSNTAAFVHELPDGAIANVDGVGDYVRVQVLTNAGALDRAKQLELVARFTEIVAVMPPSPAAAASRAVPVIRSAENGGPAGSDTRTVSWPSASQAATREAVLGSSSGLPSQAARTGTWLVGLGVPDTRGSLTVAVAARASAVRARSGSDGTAVPLGGQRGLRYH